MSSSPQDIVDSFVEFSDDDNEPDEGGEADEPQIVYMKCNCDECVARAAALEAGGAAAAVSSPEPATTTSAQPAEVPATTDAQPAEEPATTTDAQPAAKLATTSAKPADEPAGLDPKPAPGTSWFPGCNSSSSGLASSQIPIPSAIAGQQKRDSQAAVAEGSAEEPKAKRTRLSFKRPAATKAPPPAASSAAKAPPPSPAEPSPKTKPCNKNEQRRLVEGEHIVFPIRTVRRNRGKNGPEAYILQNRAQHNYVVYASQKMHPKFSEWLDELTGLIQNKRILTPAAAKAWLSSRRQDNVE